MDFGTALLLIDRPRSCRVKRIGAILAGLALTVQVGGCGSAPQTFDSPQLAIETLVQAMRTDDDKELKTIFGSDADELLSSGDAVADRNTHAEFVRLFDEQNRLLDDAEDVKTLEIGVDAWPFPIPIVEGDDGWYFDTEAGLDEILSRRIGRNELSAIQVCLAIADAQREYAAADFNGDGWREYASQFGSEAGTRNGLYWPSEPGAPESPLGEFVAVAAEEGYTRRAPGERGPRPYHGYLYRILTSQGPEAPGGAMSYMAQGRLIGGFAVVAWPAEYGNSGLKTFIISHHGLLYENDLGERTDRKARSMMSFNPDAGWTLVDQQ